MKKCYIIQCYIKQKTQILTYTVICVFYHITHKKLIVLLEDWFRHFCFLDRSPWIIGRSIGGGDFQWLIADINNIVPCASWYKNDIIRKSKILIIQRKFVFAKLNQSHPLFYAYELVVVRMHLHTNKLINRNAHQCNLHLGSCPQSRTVIIILLCCFLEINDKWVWSIIKWKGRSVFWDIKVVSTRHVISHLNQYFIIIYVLQQRLLLK